MGISSLTQKLVLILASPEPPLGLSHSLPDFLMIQMNRARDRAIIRSIACRNDPPGQDIPWTKAYVDIQAYKTLTQTHPNLGAPSELDGMTTVHRRRYSTEQMIRKETPVWCEHRIETRPQVSCCSTSSQKAENGTLHTLHVFQHFPSFLHWGYNKKKK